MDTPDYRPARLDDFAGLVDLYRNLSSDDHVASEDLQRTTFAQMLAHPGLTVLVASLESQLLATLTLIVIPNLTRGCAPYALIENVVTRIEYRGLGIGRRLMETAQQSAWQSGCYKIMLMSGAQNQKAHAFYERAGFQKSKTGFELRRPGYPSRKLD
ncbi:GNAT family N-acetyltransferase [Roseibium sp. SCPC15]|uniref:GNAT family N-acetyltransferase n=1 Tax=Roseibium sp. SCP15 TaxID=3141376 RepID=UPI00333574F1